MPESANVRTFVKTLVPPILARHLARLWPSTERPVLEFHPGGWQISPQEGSDGWNTSSVVDAETEKWEAFKRNLAGTGPLGFSHESTDLDVTRNLFFHNVHISFAYVLSLAARQAPQVSLLDWGGGLGHYYLLGKALLPDAPLDFNCRDVPLMCERGRELNPQVRFYDNDSCLDKTYDLIMINGSLGYFENWRELLSRICKSVKHYLFLTRVLTINDCPSFVALQRTEVYNYNSLMLTQVFNETELLSIVSQSGLRLVREFVVGDGPTIVGAPEQCRDCGWLFVRDQK